MTKHQTLSAVEKIEAQLLEFLKAGLDFQYFIDVFPDDPSQFDLGVRGRVALIQYLGSSYGAGAGTDEGVQTRAASWRIHLMLNQAKGDVRGIAEVEDVRQALQGKMVQGNRIQITRDGLSRNEGPIWEYLVDLAVTLPAIPSVHPAAAPYVERFTQGGVNG